MDHVQESPSIDEQPTEEQARRLEEIAAEEQQSGTEGTGASKKQEEPNEPEKQSEKSDTQKSEDKTEEEDVDLEEEEDSSDDKTKAPESRRPKFVRLDRHLKIQEKYRESEKERQKLNDRIRELEESRGDKPPTTTQVADLSQEIRSFAEEEGIDPIIAERFVRLAEAGAYTRLKHELGERFQDLDQLKSRAQESELEQRQEQIWKKQFSELIQKLPDEAENIKSIESKLKRLAFTEEYHKTPLEVIYKGVDELRPTKRRTVESGKGGSSKGSTSLDFKKIVDEGDQDAIDSMDPKTFAEFRQFIRTNNL